nr:MAG: hypothetical protein DIU68_16460 [Chloroflexota bacterium]
MNVSKLRMAQILIVDDEPLTVKLLAKLLSMMGHETVDALSSRQARDRLAYLKPDAILLDLMLPDTNGIDLLRELRADPATTDVPVIVISAQVPSREEEALAAGANGYLSKPIDLNTLRAALTDLGIASTEGA